MRKLNMICLFFFILFSMVSVSYSACEGDLNCDGDVDGSDLADFAADYGSTGCPDCIAAPVAQTGQTNCYDENGSEIVSFLLTTPESSCRTEADSVKRIQLKQL